MRGVRTHARDGHWLRSNTEVARTAHGGRVERDRLSARRKPFILESRLGNSRYAVIKTSQGSSGKSPIGDDVTSYLSINLWRTPS